MIKALANIFLQKIDEDKAYSGKANTPSALFEQKITEN